MSDLPRELLPVTDAALKLIDPRATIADERRALDLAAQHPAYVIGVLAEVIKDIHRRAEAVLGDPTGTQLDRLRAKLLGDLDDDEVLGIALNDAKRGEEVPVADTAISLPTGLSWSAPAENVGRAPVESNGETPGAATGPGVPPGDSSASPGLSGRHPADVEIDRQVQELGGRLEDTAHRWATTQTPGEIVPGLHQLGELTEALNPRGQLQLTGGAPVSAQCERVTERGRCGLRRGHPEGPWWPGENGHIGGDGNA